MKYLISLITVILVFVIGFIVVGIFNPNDGKYYSLGVKEGYAYYCNFEYEADDDIHGNEHYELGYGEGFKKAKINQCDEEYFKKL
tara:strand:- start:257 stop:511 length:255 start_codon:yes stop_codon:yes gene_type:complete